MDAMPDKKIKEEEEAEVQEPEPQYKTIKISKDALKIPEEAQNIDDEEDVKPKKIKIRRKYGDTNRKKIEV